MLAEPAHPITASQAPGLLALARRLQVRRVDEAAGRCLAKSLDLALAAQAQWGLELELVRWSVRDDPNFLDHWAVRLDARRVLDLTRVQVDGTRRLVCGLTDYPANFRSCRAYPAALFLADYRADHPVSAGTVSDRFIGVCGRRMIGHDLNRARTRGSLRDVAFVLRRWLAFELVHAHLRAVRAMERRARRLLKRTHAGPDFSRRRSVTPGAAQAAADKPWLVDLAQVRAHLEGVLERRHEGTDLPVHPGAALDTAPMEWRGKALDTPVLPVAGGR